MHRYSCKLKKGHVYKDIHIFERDKNKFASVDDNRSCENILSKKLIENYEIEKKSI
jgi:hypothetical protein